MELEELVKTTGFCSPTYDTCVNISFDVMLFSTHHPIVTVTAPNTQIVGQSLTLECNVTTVRGITSRVDIIWSRDDVELNRTISPAMINSSLFYSYTISMLSTDDEDREYKCTVEINNSPVAADSVTLDVMGIVVHFSESVMHVCIFLCSSSSYCHHITTSSHTRSYGG